MRAQHTEEWIAFQELPKSTCEQWSIGIRNPHGIHGVGPEDRYMLVGGICEAADAYKMAAAPELLAELILAREVVEHEWKCVFTYSTLDENVKPDIERLDAQLARIDAAIAKATGGAA